MNARGFNINSKWKNCTYSLIQCVYGVVFHSVRIMCEWQNESDQFCATLEAQNRHESEHVATGTIQSCVFTRQKDTQQRCSFTNTNKTPTWFKEYQHRGKSLCTQATQYIYISHFTEPPILCLHGTQWNYRLELVNMLVTQAVPRIYTWTTSCTCTWLDYFVSISPAHPQMLAVAALSQREHLSLSATVSKEQKK